MKKVVTIGVVFLFIFALLINQSSVLAQGMTGYFNSSSDNVAIQNQQQEQMGKKLLDDLNNKTVTCSKLKDADFEKIGEYFMGKMAGSSHEAMNTMMVGMMGKVGEEQMHITIGKRMSNCEPDAPMPQNMMNMMGGGGNSMMGNFGTNLTGWFGWGYGWIFMILFWGLVILGIGALIKWIVNHGKREAKSKSTLDILKERYAKGEIDKKEFEEMKKVIN